MSDTQVLLSKISALRQRLEQAQALEGEAAAGPSAEPPAEAERVRALEQRVAAGSDDGLLLDSTLRELDDAGGAETRRQPVRLTARGRRLVERGRELLDRLRALADDPAVAPPTGSADAPLAAFYRETAAMANTTLRMVQAFPDAPSAQLPLCEGMEAILGVVAQRLAVLTAAAGQRRLWDDRAEALAGLLADLFAGRSEDVKPFVALAEAVLDEAHQSAPLRFLHDRPRGPGGVARFVACHSLTAAQVMARVVRHDPDLRTRPLEPVLAALVHDVGMLGVPAEVLAS